MSGNGFVACVLMLVGVGLYFAPDQVAARVRTGISDSLRPGQLAARRGLELLRDNASRAASQSERTRQREVEQLQDRLQKEHAKTTALQIQLARVSDKKLYEGSLPGPLRSLPGLTGIELIDATVLGETLAENWRKGRLVDRGESNGVRESELVIKSGQPLVDLGHDGELSPEDSLLLGRCVIGKIERVGRWTSTFLLLTDSGYRGRAQLVHQTDSGFVFGAKGILEGQGTPCCRLKGIAASDSVVVGDAVYTATRHGPHSTPLYYGRVVDATLGPSDSEWQVLVEPVPVPNELTNVQILRTAVNTNRLSAGL